ncbi:MAG: response regulator [Candidatus Korobacteraceae bacterium]
MSSIRRTWARRRPRSPHPSRITTQAKDGHPRNEAAASPIAARAFSSPEEFLASGCVPQTKCLVLDIAMPGMSGPDLQRELKLRGREIPIIFITASTDKSVRPRLLEQGAAECLFKPFSDTVLLEALNAALRMN